LGFKRIWDLREFGIWDLRFKEFRNLGFKGIWDLREFGI